MAESLKTFTGVLTDLELARTSCSYLERAYLYQYDENMQLRAEVYYYKRLLQQSEDVDCIIKQLDKYAAVVKDLYLYTDLQDVKIQKLTGSLSIVEDAVNAHYFAYPSEMAAWLQYFTLKAMPERLRVVGTESLHRQFEFPQVQQYDQLIHFEQLFYPEAPEQDYQALYVLKCQEIDVLQQYLRMLRRRLFLAKQSAVPVNIPAFPLAELQNLSQKVQLLEQKLADVRTDYVLQKVEMPDFAALYRQMLFAVRKSRI